MTGGARRAVPRALSPEGGVARGLAILAIVWQGLWILPNPSLWPTGAASTLSAILLTAVTISWLGVVVTTWGPLADLRRREIAQAVNLIVVYAAALDLFLDLPVDSVDGWRQGASLMNLAVGLTGLLLRGRTAAPIAITAVLVEAALLVTLDIGRLPTLTTTSEILYPLYALAIATATIGGRRALMRAARRARDAREELALAEARAEAVRRVDVRLRQQERLLHETVLNTLNAIARGGLGDTGDVTERIRAISADSAAVLDSFSQDRPLGDPTAGERWSDGVDPMVSALREGGVAVDLDLPEACDPPPEVRRAFLTAVVEALRNVQRHAQARHVRVRVTCTDRALEAEIVDDGVGFDVASGRARFGLPESIRAPLAEIGGTVAIDSSPGRGTSVRLGWAAPDDRGRSTPIDTTAFVRPVLLAFGAFTLVSAILTIPGFDLPAVGIGALLLSFAAGALLLIGSRDGIMRPVVIAAVCLSAPLILRLQQIGLGDGPPDSWSDWASEAIVGLMLVIAAAGPWWAWIAALGTWVVTQGDVLGELLQPGTAVIIAGGLFARSVRANAQVSADAESLRAMESASAISDAESIRRTRERYETLSHSHARSLLSGIADGSIDPRAQEVRAACADEERFIRSVMRLDPASDPLHALASRLAVAAHDRGVPLEIDLDSGPGLPPGQLAALEDSVMSFLPCDPVGEPARLTARTEGEEFVVRLVMPCRPNEGAHPRAFDGGTVLVGDGEPFVMWELRHG